MFKTFVINLIKKLIFIIENYEYRNLDLNEDDISKKILNSIPVNDIMVYADSGYKPISELHLTQPYKEYRLITENHNMVCADNHIVFDSLMGEVFVKDLEIGDLIQTKNGLEEVKSVVPLKYSLSMFDASVDDEYHRLYTNGILSHNTISSSIFILHFIMFNNDKNVMIIANKGDTVIEIVDKIKGIYTLLPFFLKAGIKEWNKKNITFENGSRIKTSARTKTPAVGFTIDLLYLDEFAHIPENIINPFYRAAYPTVSAIENSKIIITSTPNGMNLFHDILIDAERPESDPEKNNFKAMRVYWYQTKGRFVTYLRLNDHKLHEQSMTRDEVYEIVEKEWGSVTDIKEKINTANKKYEIWIYNNEDVSVDDIRDFRFQNEKGYQLGFVNIGVVTTWKDEAIKDIQGIDNFNQEYGLRFINASNSLLDEAIIEKLLDNRVAFEYKILEPFEKLRFSYEGLKWLNDESRFSHDLIRDYKFILSVDLSEGLGQDFSVINIFKVGVKDKEVIEKQKTKYDSMLDFFRLEQVGMFRSNTMSIKQMSEILYILAFEYLNPENVKIVLELNTYGNTLLAEMPHVFEGNNEYGSYIFTRHKHTENSTELKIGLKVGSKNKNILIKDYQDRMRMKSYDICEYETINEITKFIKHTTAAGNVRYGADVGHDDTVMTIVDSTTVWDMNFFKEMVEQFMDEMLPVDFKQYIMDCMNESDYIEPVDYTQVLNAKRMYSSFYKSQKSKSSNNYGSQWFGI